MIVKYIAKFVVLFCILIKEWWAHVTVIPLDKRTTVLRSGIWNGFKGETPRGGQEFPNSRFGAKELLKKDQKKLKKKYFGANK